MLLLLPRRLRIPAKKVMLFLGGSLTRSPRHGLASSTLGLTLLLLLIETGHTASNATCQSEELEVDECQLLGRRTVKEVFENALSKGTKIVDALNSQTIEAISHFEDEEALSAAGYKITNQEGNLPAEQFGPFLEDMGLKLDRKAWMWTANQPTSSSDSGSYDLWLQPQNGVLQAIRRYRSVEPKEDKVWRPSDILAIAWKSINDKNFAGKKHDIKYFFADNVSNGNTFSILQVYAELKKWPGVTYDMSTDVGKAILGSPNGISFGYMLLQHPSLFPKKTITKVQVFYFMEAFPCLIFFVADAPEQGRTGNRD